jgi:hypothetical protein
MKLYLFILFMCTRLFCAAPIVNPFPFDDPLLPAFKGMCERIQPYVKSSAVAPTCFLSYAWPEDGAAPLRGWFDSIYECLNLSGVHVVYDTKSFTGDVSKLEELARNSSKILILLTPDYKKKCDLGTTLRNELRVAFSKGIQNRSLVLLSGTVEMGLPMDDIKGSYIPGNEIINLMVPSDFRHQQETDGPVIKNFYTTLCNLLDPTKPWGLLSNMSRESESSCQKIIQDFLNLLRFSQLKSVQAYQLKKRDESETQSDRAEILDFLKVNGYFFDDFFPKRVDYQCPQKFRDLLDVCFNEDPIDDSDELSMILNDFLSETEDLKLCLERSTVFSHISLNKKNMQEVFLNLSDHVQSEEAIRGSDKDVVVVYKSLQQGINLLRSFLIMQKFLDENRAFRAVDMRYFTETPLLEKKWPKINILEKMDMIFIELSLYYGEESQNLYEKNILIIPETPLLTAGFLRECIDVCKNSALKHVQKLAMQNTKDLKEVFYDLLRCKQLSDLQNLFLTVCVQWEQLNDVDKLSFFNGFMPFLKAHYLSLDNDHRDEWGNMLREKIIYSDLEMGKKMLKFCFEMQDMINKEAEKRELSWVSRGGLDRNDELCDFIVTSLEENGNVKTRSGELHVTFVAEMLFCTKKINGRYVVSDVQDGTFYLTPHMSLRLFFSPAPSAPTIEMVKKKLIKEKEGT